MRQWWCGVVFLSICLCQLQAAVHTVRKGETLYSISRRYHVPVSQIETANPVLKKRGGKLSVGQRLQIPTTTRMRVSNPAKRSSKPKSRPIEIRKAYPVGYPVIEARPESTQSSSYIFINPVKSKIDSPRVRPGHWKYIVLHHSGTPSGNARIFEYFHRHVRGMENGMAYHFVIGNGHDSGDGQIEVGNRWLKQLQGGHLHSDSLNEISIGICFVGNFNKDHPTKKQIAAAIELISYLNQRCGSHLVFKVHREINPRPTECPGKLFPSTVFHQLFD